MLNLGSNMTIKVVYMGISMMTLFDTNLILLTGFQTQHELNFSQYWEHLNTLNCLHFNITYCFKLKWTQMIRWVCRQFLLNNIIYNPKLEKGWNSIDRQNLVYTVSSTGILEICLSFNFIANTMTKRYFVMSHKLNFFWQYTTIYSVYISELQHIKKYKYVGTIR